MKIDYRPHPEPDSRDEVALVRLNNYREPKPEEPPAPEGAAGDSKQPSRPQSPPKKEDGDVSGIPEGEDPNISMETFNADDIPPKIILFDPNQKDQDIQMIMYHAEAQYAVRKVVIEAARKHFKELEKLNLNAVLAHTAQKSKQLDERFEDHVVR